MADRNAPAWVSSLLRAGCLIAVLTAITGCQQAQPVSMIEPLPNPNFAGPTLPATSVVAAPQRQAVAVAAAEPAAPIAPYRKAAPPAGIPREWVPNVTPNTWRWIVIHHSATTVGGAVRFDAEHRKTRGWDELGYHFVIGNGTDTSNGLVEVGPRWPKQKWGAHAKTPSEEFNQHGIGICLVGDFDKSTPSDAQMRSLAKLTAYLMKTYHIPADHIIGHGDTKATDCPGRNMHVATVRRMSAQILADAGANVPESRTRTASADLMYETTR